MINAIKNILELNIFYTELVVDMRKNGCSFDYIEDTLHSQLSYSIEDVKTDEGYYNKHYYLEK